MGCMSIFDTLTTSEPEMWGVDWASSRSRRVLDGVGVPPVVYDTSLADIAVFKKAYQWSIGKDCRNGSIGDAVSDNYKTGKYKY